MQAVLEAKVSSSADACERQSVASVLCSLASIELHPDARAKCTITAISSQAKCRKCLHARLHACVSSIMTTLQHQNAAHIASISIAWVYSEARKECMLAKQSIAWALCHLASRSAIQECNVQALQILHTRAAKVVQLRCRAQACSMCHLQCIQCSVSALSSCTCDDMCYS